MTNKKRKGFYCPNCNKNNTYKKDSKGDLEAQCRIEYHVCNNCNATFKTQNDLIGIIKEGFPSQKYLNEQKPLIIFYRQNMDKWNLLKKAVESELV